MDSHKPDAAAKSVMHSDQTLRGRLYKLMADEHARLDNLLAEATESVGVAATESYRRFREGLLRHISIEEKILLPTAQRRRGGTPLPLAEKLRLDHGALAALVMLPPSVFTFRAVRAVLDAHNPLEESPGGVYEQCESLIESELDEVLFRCETVPRVPVSPWVDRSKVFVAVKLGLMRAGYDEALLVSPGATPE